MLTSRDDLTVESLRNLVNASARACSIGCIVRDTETRFVTVNSARALMAGASPEEHVGKTTREMMGTMAEQVEHILIQVMTKRCPISTRISGRLPRKDGDGEWVCRYVPVKGIFGDVKMIATLVIDVSAQRKLGDSVALLEENRLLVPEMKDWAKELRESLKLFDFAMHQTLTEISASARDMHRLVDRVKVLDACVGKIKQSLIAQAHWLPGASLGTNYLN
jgi:PAS domain S-box-containing protein